MCTRRSKLVWLLLLPVLFPVSCSDTTWFNGVFGHGGPGLFMSRVPFQHTSPWACSTERDSRIPRMAFQNDSTDPYYSILARIWVRSYAAVAAASEGLPSLEKPEIVEEKSPEEVALVHAFGYLNLGLSQETVALLCDRDGDMGLEVNLESVPVFLPYRALKDVASGIRSDHRMEMDWDAGWYDSILDYSTWPPGRLARRLGDLGVLAFGTGVAYPDSLSGQD